MNPFWNSKERRLRAGWRILGQLLLQFVLVLVLGFLAGLLSPVIDLGAIATAAGGLLTMAFFTVAAVLSVWLAGRLLDRRPFVDFGFHYSAQWWADFAFGLALGALLMAVVFTIELAAGWITVTGVFVTQGAPMPAGVALLIPLVLFIFVGIEEELLVRGYGLHNLAEGFNFRPLSPAAATVVAWVVTSIVFGFLHALNPNVTPFSIVNLVLAGLLLGLGYILTGELAIPIGLHISWNFFQGGVFGFPVSGTTTAGGQVFAIEQRGPDLWTGGAFGPEGGLLVTALSILAGLVVLLWVRYTRGEVRLAMSLPQPPGREGEA